MRTGAPLARQPRRAFTGRNPALDLTSLGWNSHFSDVFSRFAGDGMVAGRVVSDQRHIYTIQCAEGELAAEVSGRFRMEAGRKIDFPVVGDWVAAAARPAEGKATIHAVLPRASLLSRRSPGEKTEEQPVAANLDSAFIITSLDWDFNVRRIERYLTLAWANGIQPVVGFIAVQARRDLSERVETQNGGNQHDEQNPAPFGGFVPWALGQGGVPSSLQAAWR